LRRSVKEVAGRRADQSPARRGTRRRPDESGAQNAALDRKIGTLTPGKEADVVAIRADDINMIPLTNAISSVVSYAHPGNVDTVLIAGEIRKWRGRLVGHDLATIRARVQQSRDDLFERKGQKLNILT